MMNKATGSTALKEAVVTLDIREILTQLGIEESKWHVHARAA